MDRQEQFRRSVHPMLLCDDDHVIVAVNRVACLLLRLTAKHLEGLQVEDLVVPGQESRLVAVLAPIDRRVDPPEAAEPSTPTTVGLSLPDGGRLVVDLTCTPRVSEGVHALRIDFPASGPLPATPRVLTEREREVMTQVALGRTGQEIAADLFVAPATIESHVSRALTKLHARNRPHGVALAIRTGEISDTPFVMPAVMGLADVEQILETAYPAVRQNGDDFVESLAEAREVGSQRRAAVLRDADRARARGLREIREAIEERQFVLYAQPVVDLVTGRAVRHELHTHVAGHNGAPVAVRRVYRVAREHGLVRQVDRWGLEQALRLSAAGHAVELDLSLESTIDSTWPTLLEPSERPEDARLDLVTLGLPQAALGTDLAQTASLMRRLARWGMPVTLADFGFGYAGVAHLRELPWSEVKLDINLIPDLRERESSRGVMRAFVELAKGFGLGNVVRGVEDDAVPPLLRELGVGLAQGHALGSSQPEELAFSGAPHDE